MDLAIFPLICVSLFLILANRIVYFKTNSRLDKQK
jgi:hypothetical protein